MMLYIFVLLECPIFVADACRRTGLSFNVRSYRAACSVSELFRQVTEYRVLVRTRSLGQTRYGFFLTLEVESYVAAFCGEKQLKNLFDFMYSKYFL